MSDHLLQQRAGLRLPEFKGSVNLLPHVFKNVSEGILFIQLDGRISEINPSALKILKVKEEGPSPYYWDLFSDDFFGFSMRESLKFGISHRLIYKSWMGKELEISSTFVLDGPRIDHGLLVFCRDLTEIKRLQLNGYRNERINELGTMTASIAHEIRNPLGGIRGFAMLLYRDLQQQPALQEMAASIIEGTKGMERLVNRLLHYARPITVELRSIELGYYLKQLGRFLQVDPTFPLGVRLVMHIPNDPILVPIDPEMVKSALLNLAFNAFQAMPQGGVLTIALMKSENSCQISFSDTGIGMSEEQLSSLFTPFFTTKQKGTGLGLFETKKIIQAHGGAIEARSSLGKGATFLLTLPLKRGLS